MITPTRMNLIMLRNRLKVITKSADILDMKRQILLDRFFKYIDELKKEREEESKVVDRLYEAYFNSSSFLGSFRLIQLAYIINNKIDLDLSVENLMSVPLPSLKSNIVSKYKNLLFESLSLDDLYNNYYNMINIIIKYAQNEHAVRNLAMEIDKLKRRINSLNYIIEPSIKKDIKSIIERLDEIERSQFYMLKHIKKKREKQ